MNELLLCSSGRELYLVLLMRGKLSSLRWGCHIVQSRKSYFLLSILCPWVGRPICFLHLLLALDNKLDGIEWKDMSFWRRPIATRHRPWCKLWPSSTIVVQASHTKSVQSSIVHHFLKPPFFLAYISTYMTFHLGENTLPYTRKTRGRSKWRKYAKLDGLTSFAYALQ